MRRAAQYFCSASIRGAALLLLGATVAAAAEPSTPAVPKKPAAAGGSAFGINPAWVKSPDMLDAMNRLQEAGQVEGRRGSLTFFRWSTPRLEALANEPPVLAHLGLWGAKVGNGEVALVAALADLEHVSLYETNVDDAGLAALAKLPKLRSLSITRVTRYEKAGFGAPQWSYPFLAERAERPRITGRGLQAFAGTATLEKVDLLDARLTSADLGILRTWPRLSVLSLPAVGSSGIDSETVAHLEACPRLNNLTLGHREVTADELRELSRWKSLRRLTLIHARLSDEALGALAALSTVEELRLEDCGLTDERLRYLQVSGAGPPKLTSLVLERNEIEGPGLAHLAKLNLTSLGLEFNNLRDETLEHLAQLKSLERLSLSYCRGVTDAGLRSGPLAAMSRLKHLGLRGLSQVTDGALDDLTKFGHLEHLTIRETKISWDGVERLKQALPKTVVFK